MRSLITITAVIFAILSLVSGCGSRAKSRDASSQDVNGFLAQLEKELKQFPSFGPTSGGGGQSGNIRTMDSTFYVDTTECSPDRVSAIAQEAYDSWGRIDSFGARGKGSGGNQFSFHFGNQRTHVFVDVIGYTEESTTKILCLVRAVE